MRRWRWRISAALALLCFGLGLWGYALKYPVVPFWDRLYASTGLFRDSTTLFGNGGFPLPWQLEVARWLAPLVVAVVTVSAIVTLFAQQVTHLRVALYRNHVIVCGLGEFGQRLVRALDDQGARVVAVDDNPSAAALNLVQERFIPLLQGNATDPEVLLYAQVDHARSLIAVCGDDGTNTDVGMTARSCTPKRRHNLDCYVQIDDPELCQLLSRSSLENASGKTHLNYVNTLEAGPRAIVEAFRYVFEADDGSPATYVLIGSAPIGAQLTIEVARSWWFTRDEGDTRRVLQVLLAHDATTQVSKLTEAYPDLTSACDLRPIDLNVDVAPADALCGAIEANVPDHTTVFVARQSESATLRTVLTLPDEVSTRFPVVALTSRSVGTTAALAEQVSSRQRSKVSNFAVLDQLCVPKAFMNSLNERLAQTLHKSYLQDRRADGSFDPTKDSHRDWEHLDEKFKEINRDHAAGIFDRVDQFGYEVRPTESWSEKPVSWDTEPITFPTEQVEEMAKFEHERWMKSLQGRGWRFGASLYPGGQRHPDLVPWEELTPAEQERDREPVRELPRTLARFGFIIGHKEDST